MTREPSPFKICNLLLAFVLHFEMAWTFMVIPTVQSSLSPKLSSNWSFFFFGEPKPFCSTVNNLNGLTHSSRSGQRVQQCRNFTCFHPSVQMSSSNSNSNLRESICNMANMYRNKVLIVYHPKSNSKH